MSSPFNLSEVQRNLLTRTLQSQLVALESQRELRLQGSSQAEDALQTRQQDADDATQRAGEHEVEATVSDIDSGEFEAIRSALDRIRGANYGKCVDCRKPIPFERLKVEPQAMRCASCESVRERKP